MPKSLTNFDEPRTARPIVVPGRDGGSLPGMQYGPDGTYVPIEDYRALLLAYKGRVVQLKRAGERVAELKRNAGVMEVASTDGRTRCWDCLGQTMDEEGTPCKTCNASGWLAGADGVDLPDGAKHG